MDMMDGFEKKVVIREAYEALLDSPVHHQVGLAGWVLNFHENGLVTWGKKHEEVKARLEAQRERDRDMYRKVFKKEPKF